MIALMNRDLPTATAPDTPLEASPQRLPRARLVLASTDRDVQDAVRGLFGDAIHGGLAIAVPHTRLPCTIAFRRFPGTFAFSRLASAFTIASACLRFTISVSHTGLLRPIAIACTFFACTVPFSALLHAIGFAFAHLAFFFAAGAWRIGFTGAFAFTSATRLFFLGLSRTEGKTDKQAKRGKAERVEPGTV